MKVKVTFTIDIDADAWELNYGTERAKIREDVKDYAYHIVTAQFADQDLLAEDAA